MSGPSRTQRRAGGVGALSSPSSESVGEVSAAAPEKPTEVADGFEAKPLNLSLPSLGAELEPRAILTPAARDAMKAAVDAYTARLEAMVLPSAMTLARGAPAKLTGGLTAEQEAEFRAATTDFIEHVPLSVFSPEIAARVQKSLEREGVKVPDLQLTQVGQLGSVARTIASDVAKEYLAGLKRDSPAAYYGLAASAAAAIGYVAWEKGSARLSELGIKPELHKSFFNSKLEVRVGAEWLAHFEETKLTGTLVVRTPLGKDGKAGSLAASVTANSRTGLDNARLDYAFTRPALNGAAYVTSNSNGVELVGASVTRVPNKNLNLTARAEHNLVNGNTTATAEVAWHASKNVDVAASASTDSNHQTRVGVGVKVKF